jgi:predicted transcriptional regulator
MYFETARENRIKPMTTLILDVANDLAAALARQSQTSKISVQALSAAVLEQWFLDQDTPPQQPWLPDDVAAIEVGLAQSRAGQTISHGEASARLLAKAK